MKNRMKKIVSFCLVLLLIFLQTACASGGGDEISFKKTGENIIENGKSEYVIVIPKEADSVTNLAANELNEFLKRSTGVKLEIVTDAGLKHEKEARYISLGETELLASVGIKPTKDDMGESGYVMKTVDRSLYISGVTAKSYNGTIYGVYDWLHYTIGYHAYAVDEIIYEEMDTVPLYQFDEKHRPSFDVREVDYKFVKNDDLYRYRMYGNGGSQSVWNSFAHTNITVYLSYEEYGEAHPDWYVGQGEQICLSNEGVLKEMIQQVQKRLTTYPVGTYVMLGREDNSTLCTCEKCAATTAKYGGNYSGLELEFTNKVAEAVDEWLKATGSEEKITYMFFAYGPTLSAPVNYDEQKDTFTPIVPDMEIRDNVGVLIAPISMDFSKSPTDSVNAGPCHSMKAWSSLFGKKNIAIWSYSLCAYSYMFNFNNFGILEEYYRFYRDIGVDVLYDQANWDGVIPAFNAMRVYCHHQLGWDCTQDYEELAMDFMDHYYGEGAEAIKEYYHFLRAHYRYLDDNDNSTGMVFFLMDDKKLWPLGTVQTLMSYMDEALEAIEPLKETDEERYEQLHDRIQMERLSPLYMMLQYYNTQLADEVKESYIADFETYSTKFGIEMTREAAYDLQSVIDNWKKS